MYDVIRVINLQNLVEMCAFQRSSLYSLIALIYTICVKGQISDFKFDIKMPSVQPLKADQYFCTSKLINVDQAFIVGFEPLANGTRVHHMILFGSNYSEDNSKIYPNFWDCGHKGLHRGVSIMFAWARNAPPVIMPKDVGFYVGQKTSVTHLILQVHYAKELDEGDRDDSGLQLSMTVKQQKYSAGIFILGNSIDVIRPRVPKVTVDVSCPYLSDIPIYTFAYRVHTHKLGVVISGYKYDGRSNTFTLLAKGNPQWPQAFFPMNQTHTITKNDTLIARCTYDSSLREETTVMGATSKDEMCNLYLMYYSKVERGVSLSESSCNSNLFPSLTNRLPPGNDVALPKNPLLEEVADNLPDHSEQIISYQNSPTFPLEINLTKKTNLHRNLMDPDSEEFQPNNDLDLNINHHHQIEEPEFDINYSYNEVSNWPKVIVKFGQITAVTFDSQGNVVVFHRGSHVWNDHTFDLFDNYLPIDDGPISEYTIVTLDPVSGRILHHWGEELFYLPHGLTIDKNGIAWITDVALHQVFKFPEKGDTKAMLTLGQRFENGNDQSHFCKPTSVAIDSDGDIFIADGYCNSRIVRYSGDGKYLSQFGERSTAQTVYQPLPNTFFIPHKVILVQQEKLICVADRENGRIQCFTKIDGKYSFQIARKEFHGRLFSVAGAEVEGGLLYSVCGNAIPPDNHPVQAFVFNLTSKAMLNIIMPKQGTFSQPHDIAVSSNAENIYVVEIGPNNIWKFEKAIHKSAKKILEVTTESHKVAETPALLKTETEVPKKPLTSSSVVAEASNFATSMVIMALLGIPVLLLILITVIFRLKKRGKFQHCSLPHVKGWLGGYRAPYTSQEKFNIGSLLNPHRGFDRVALDESDLDGEDKSDSDIEEFNAAIRKA